MNENGKPRESSDVIREILSATKEPQSSHGIICEVGINYAALKKYASALLGSHLLKEVSGPGSRVRYVSTQRGSEVLASLESSLVELEEVKKNL